MSGFYPGQKLNVKIESVANGGQGVARISDFVIFVPYASPGDEVEIILGTVKKSYAVGKILSFKSFSAFRIKPECPYFFQCGGCSFQHISYDGQLRIKERFVKDALERIGGISEYSFSSILPSKPFGYRNKVQFVVSGEKSGLYAFNSHRIIEIDRCELQNDLSNKILRRCKDFLRGGLSDASYLKHIGIRTSSLGTAQVTFVAKRKKIRGLKEAAERLCSEFPCIGGVSLNVNPENTNVIYGKNTFILVGSGRIEERLLNRKFYIGCESFFQVNLEAAEKLAKTVLSFMPEKSDSILLDAYCGSGFFTMFSAERYKKAIGVEEHAASIVAAKELALENGILNAEFLCLKTEDFLSAHLSEKVGWAVLDPPRKGLEPSVILSLAESGVSNIIYVSCNPSTLARDLKVFCERGYKVRKVRPIDMFPQTVHVETVVLLSRSKPDDTV